MDNYVAGRITPGCITPQRIADNAIQDDPFTSSLYTRHAELCEQRDREDAELVKTAAGRLKLAYLKRTRGPRDMADKMLRELSDAEAAKLASRVAPELGEELVRKRSGS